MNTKKYIYFLITLILVGGFSIVSVASAQDNKMGNRLGQKIIKAAEVQAVFGKVTAISGNTITVLGKNANTSTDSTFTVDATSAKIIKNGVAGTISSIVIGDTISVQGTVTGTNIVATTIRDGKLAQLEMDLNAMRPDVIGKVSAISGNTITVISNRGSNNTPTTYTVDATNAKLLRGNNVITISNIAIGDNIIVQGTVTGTNVVAVTIRDGKVGNGKNENDNNQALLQIQGNGQPIVAGTISAISGSTITITNSSNVTYTIDASKAKIVQGKNTILITGVKVGDSVIVQGAVNGTSVTASTIIDQTKITTNQTGQTGGNQGQKLNRGLFGSIGQFFRKLFGF